MKKQITVCFETDTETEVEGEQVITAALNNLVYSGGDIVGWWFV